MRKMKGQNLHKGDIFKQEFMADGKIHYEILEVIDVSKRNQKGILVCIVLDTDWKEDVNSTGTWGLYNHLVYRFNENGKMVWKI